jgi:hypothetical protein
MATTPGSLTFNNLTYKISDLQYPEDLDTSEQYGQNRVIFLINVVGESKLDKNSVFGKPVADIPQNEYKASIARQNVERVAAAGGKLGESLGMDTVSALRSTLKMKRLLSAISLYIPNDLSTSYGVTWGEEEKLDGTGIRSQLGSDLLGGKGAFSSALTFFGTAIARGALENKGLQKAARVTQNTKKEQLFQGVDFRTINFSYQFAPKNEIEAANVLQIIRMFRHHMLPEFADENQFIYIYPSEFEIKYFKGDKESEYLERHFTAVLTNCIINYTPTGQFVTFENGMPSQINMTLTFKELFLPSKESSGDGSFGDPGK